MIPETLNKYNFLTPYVTKDFKINVWLKKHLASTVYIIEYF